MSCPRFWLAGPQPGLKRPGTWPGILPSIPRDAFTGANVLVSDLLPHHDYHVKGQLGSI